MRFRLVLALALLAAAALAVTACGESEAPAPESGTTSPATEPSPIAQATQPGSSPSYAGTASPTPVPQSASMRADTATPTAVPQTTSTQADTATPTATPADTAGPMHDPEDGSGYEDLLSLIPDSPDVRREVYLNDYALVRRLFDIPLPGPGDGDDALEEFYHWVPPLGYDPDSPAPVIQFGAISFFGPFNHLRYLKDNLQYLAFDARNLDRGISAGVPPGGIDIERGRFDPQATDRALEACSECVPVTRENYKGVAYYTWAEDGLVQDPNLRWAPPAFDYLGRGGRIAVLDEYLIRANTSREIQSIIDARMKEVPSLADVEEFRLLAGAMSDLGAYVMMLSDGVAAFNLDGLAKQTLGDDASQSDLDAFKQVAREAAGGVLLHPYVAYATGAGFDGDGPYMSLAVVHDHAAAAEENVARLPTAIEVGTSLLTGQPWSESIDVRTSEFRSEGRVLLAKLRGGIFGNWLNWVYQRDSLLLHE